MRQLRQILSIALLTLCFMTVSYGGTITGSKTGTTATRVGTITGSRTGTITGSRVGTITGSRITTSGDPGNPTRLGKFTDDLFFQVVTFLANWMQ